MAGVRGYKAYGPVKVVGFLFGGGDGGGLAVPIDQVISGFSDLGLSFELAPGRGFQTSCNPSLNPLLLFAGIECRT